MIMNTDSDLPADTGAVAKPGKRPDFRARTTARLGAVQVLYEIGMNPDRTAEQAVKDYLAMPPTDPDLVEPAPLVPPAAELLSRIVRGVAHQDADLDPILDAEITAPWQPERIEPLLRCLLRAGTYELLSHGQFDAALLIKEYVTVADGFFSEREPSLVNAVLDRVARKVRG